MDNNFKILVDLLGALDETAIDIYWGNHQDFSKEDSENFTESDYKEAFSNACAELAFDSIDAEWFLELPPKLAEYYGRHLKTIYVKKGLYSNLSNKE